MDFEKQKISADGIKILAKDRGKIIGRAFLYILKNDLHDRPFGFMEDVFVEEKFRRQGLGAGIIQEVIAEAKRQGCYKLVGTSRHSRTRAHEFYKKLGFTDWGKEFRMDLNNN